MGIELGYQYINTITIILNFKYLNILKYLTVSDSKYYIQVQTWSNQLWRSGVQKKNPPSTSIVQEKLVRHCH